MNKGKSMSSASLVEVTQADRDAAAAFWQGRQEPFLAEKCQSGEFDERPRGLNQALARHRLASIEEAAARIEALEKALDEALDALETEASFTPHDLSETIQNGRKLLAASVLSEGQES